MLTKSLFITIQKYKIVLVNKYIILCYEALFTSTIMSHDHYIVDDILLIIKLKKNVKKT